jgi:hypothetical protein
MAEGQRTPPRFVPTLTAVVDEPPVASPVAPASSEPKQPVASVEHAVPPAALAALTEADAQADAFQFEEQLMHRVLQRIDLSLEERLTDAVSAAVQQQLDTMLPRLRAEIEDVLRAVVVEALALELSGDPGSAPTPGPQTFG